MIQRRRGDSARRAGGGEPPPFLVVGKVLAPWGTKGEVKVQSLCNSLERFAALERVYVGESPLAIQGQRPHKGHLLVKFLGVDTKAAAERLRGAELEIPRAEAVPLKEGEYYYYQVVGLEVWSTAGERLGWVEDIFPTGSNEVYVVRGPQGQLLVPAIEDVIKGIDLEGGRLVVELIEGLR